MSIIRTRSQALREVSLQSQPVNGREVIQRAYSLPVHPLLRLTEDMPARGSTDSSRGPSTNRAQPPPLPSTSGREVFQRAHSLPVNPSLRLSEGTSVSSRPNHQGASRNTDQPVATVTATRTGPGSSREVRINLGQQVTFNAPQTSSRPFVDPPTERTIYHDDDGLDDQPEQPLVGIQPTADAPVQDEAGPQHPAVYATI
jgi:hypothetical protein